MADFFSIASYKLTVFQSARICPENDKEQGEALDSGREMEKRSKNTFNEEEDIHFECNLLKRDFEVDFVEN